MLSDQGSRRSGRPAAAHRLLAAHAACPAACARTGWAATPRRSGPPLRTEVGPSGRPPSPISAPVRRSDRAETTTSPLPTLPGGRAATTRPRPGGRRSTLPAPSWWACWWWPLVTTAVGAGRAMAGARRRRRRRAGHRRCAPRHPGSAGQGPALGGVDPERSSHEQPASRRGRLRRDHLRRRTGADQRPRRRRRHADQGQADRRHRARGRPGRQPRPTTTSPSSRSRDAAASCRPTLGIVGRRCGSATTSWPSATPWTSAASPTRHRGHRVGQGPHDRRPRTADARAPHPDRRRHQPRQLGRPAGQRRRPGHRHQHRRSSATPRTSASPSPSTRSSRCIEEIKAGKGTVTPDMAFLGSVHPGPMKRGAHRRVGPAQRATPPTAPT